MSSSAVQPLLALLAHPVGGNPTQYMMEKAFAYHDLDWRYLTFEVGANDLADAVRGMKALGFRGGHCADPHKESVIPLLDRVTDSAATVGSVNLVFRDGDALVGDNAEGRGVAEALRGATDPAGKRIVLLGAGRLARAAALELAASEPASLWIVDRTPDRAGALAAMLTGRRNVAVQAVTWTPDFSVPPEADILVSAAKFRSESGEAFLPIAPESLRPELLVADAALGPPRSVLLAEAAQRGCRTIDGLAMFLAQIAGAFRLWTRVDPNPQVLREAVEEFWEL